MKTSVRLLLCASLALLVAPGAASAGTARVGEGQLIFTGGDVRESVQVRLTRAGEFPDGRRYYEVSDLGRDVAAGPGCKKIPFEQYGDPLSAYCPPGIKSIRVLLGAGNDTARAGTARVPLTFNGEAGKDELFGETTGPRATLNGGTGDDRLEGYYEARNPITARGGPGNDFLAGSCYKADTLLGGAGADKFDTWGDGKADTVKGGKGRDSGHVDKKDILSSFEDPSFDEAPNPTC